MTAAPPSSPRSAPAEPLVPSAPPLFGLRVAYALAVLSGVLYFLGVPGMNVWPIAFVTKVPLLLAIRGRTPKTAAWIGLVAGFSMSMFGFYWLYGMLRVFSGFPAVVCALVMASMCAYQAGRMALTTWLTARADVRGWSAPLAFVLASIACELLYPLLFPWYFAFMMHDTPALMQVADLGGVYLAGALLLGPNLAIAELVRAFLERSRKGAAPLRRVVVAAGLAAPLVSAAYGALRMARVASLESAAQSVTVGIAQGNLPLLDRKEGAAIQRRLTEALRDRGANLVVWSEGSIAEVFDDADYKKTARRITNGLAVPVLIGAGIMRRTKNGRRELNSALLADADGSIVGRYDKQYLMPFGEFIPFGETFPWLYARSPNSGRLIPGDSVKPVVLAGHPISVLICYEDILPWFVSRAVAEGRPELLVNMTVDTWFGRTIAPWEHLALAQFRAVEHRRYLVRSTNSGVSAIVDAIGRVVLHGGIFDEESLLGDVRLMSPTTVYEVIGDTPFYIVTFVIAGMAIFRRRPLREIVQRGSAA